MKSKIMKTMCKQIVWCSVVGMLLVSTTAQAADWPCFRGPNRDGSSPEQITASFPLQVLWTTNVGFGFCETTSGNGYIYTSGYINGNDYVYCLNPNTGATVWQANHSAPGGLHTGPRATLTIDNGKVYLMSSESMLYCYDQGSGAELWNRNINTELGFQCWQGERGEASSPIIEGNLILFCFGSGGAALNKSNGAKVWCNNNGDGGGKINGYSFCSAAVYSSGPDRIAAFVSMTSGTGGGCTGVKVATGEIVWTFLPPAGFSCSDLMVYGNKIWFSEGYYDGTASRAYTLGTGTLPQAAVGCLGSGNTPNTLYNGYLYGIDKPSRDGANRVVCMDADTGALKWVGVDNDECGGTIACGNKILLATQANTFPNYECDIVLIDSNPSGYSELGRQKLWAGGTGGNGSGGSGGNLRPSIANGKLYVRQYDGKLICLNAVGTPSTPVITSATTASGMTGQSFSYQITASGSPTSYNATGLPAGLSVNTSSGLISGMPTAIGTNSVTISASNGSGTGTATLTITITAPAAPVITSATTANGTINQAFSYQITASGSPTSYGASGLPAGLSVNTSSGLISGTPTSVGASAVTLSATSANGTGTATLTITISATAPGPTGLVGWWKLDESSGTAAADSSGNGNNGTLSGGTWQSAGGHIGGAIQFAWGNLVNCGAGTSLNTPSMTVAFWMKAESLQNANPIDKLPSTTGVGYAVKTRDNGSIWFRVGAEPGSAMDVYGAVGIYAAGTWVHIACTFDNATGALRLYKNGVVDANQPTWTTTLNAPSTAFTISSTREPFVGMLDDVRVYDHALSATEIQAVMTGGGGTVQPAVISSMKPAGNMPELGWTSASGVTYAVYKSTNLLSGWILTPLTNIAGDGTAKVFADPSPTQPAAFYKVTAR